MARPYLAKASYGGESRIRTYEGITSGFTVRPLWPLGNLTKVQPILEIFMPYYNFKLTLLFI